MNTSDPAGYGYTVERGGTSIFRQFPDSAEALVRIPTKYTTTTPANAEPHVTISDMRDLHDALGEFLAAVDNQDAEEAAASGDFEPMPEEFVSMAGVKTYGEGTR